jgi:hypothetical protein
LAIQSARDVIDESMIIVPSLFMPVTQTPLSSGRSHPPVTPFGTAPSPMYLAWASSAVMSIGITSNIHAANISREFLGFMFPSPLFICFYAKTLSRPCHLNQFLHLVVYIAFTMPRFFQNIVITGENEPVLLVLHEWRA